MASLGSVCRSSARAVLRSTVRNGHRGFKTTPQPSAASNFAMPALSPTMTEGNIASWKVKEGDSFSPGDVLLEIETDKAQMDVEAQDEGVMAKIIQQDGAKAVQVGTRIAVLAEPGDDLSSLEIPPEDSTPQKSEPPKQEQESKKESSSQPKPDTKPFSSSSETSSRSTSDSKQTGKTGPQRYPLYPSVQHLLQENGLSKEDANKIPATGPAGRLLKGDVLAYVGKISKSHPGDLSSRLDKLSHLDLKNIKLAKPSPPKKDTKAPAEAAAAEDLATEVAVPISLSAVLATQKKLKDTLGLDLPITTFIARAVDLANQDLPRKKTAPTADELFDAVLGLDKKKLGTSTGTFIPQITALPLSRGFGTAGRRPKSDILDILAGKKVPSRTAGPSVPQFPAETNVFSLNVKKGDVKRAEVFLERMKGVLEKDVGLLVL